MKNQVQLIAYVDRLSDGGFRDLRELLERPLNGLFGGIHLLPFFWPIDGGDRLLSRVGRTALRTRPVCTGRGSAMICAQAYEVE